MAEDIKKETTTTPQKTTPTEKKVEVSKDKLDEILNLVKSQAKKLEIQEKKISDLETGEQKPKVMKRIKEHYVRHRDIDNEDAKEMK